MKIGDIEISKAYELKPGATYCIQYDMVLSKKQREIITRELLGNSDGIKFIILEGGLRLVEPPESVAA